MNHKKIVVALLLCLTTSISLMAQDVQGHTHSGRGTGQAPFPLETYQELTNPVPTDMNQWKGIEGTKVGWGSTDVRYKKELPAEMEAAPVKRLVAWKGERVAAQLVVSTAKPMEKLRLEVTDLKKEGSSQSIAKEQIFKGFVRYVMTDELNKDGRGGCGNRPDSRMFDSTLVADPIDHLVQELAMKPYTTQGCWLRVQVPSEAKQGIYTGQVSVYDGQEILTSLTLEVEVKGHVLPPPMEWAFHLDLWQNPFAIARYHGVKPWTPEHFKAMEPYMALYRDAGGKVITASIMHKPWNGQTFDYFESMVKWVKQRDGSWRFDFDVFDRWVQFMMDLGIDEQIDCYSMIPWNLTFQYYDELYGYTQNAYTGPGDPLYNEMWRAMLTAFTKHLKEKGWFERTCISMDERPMHQMFRVIDLVQSVDRNFKITLAGNKHGEMMEALYDYSVPLNQKYSQDELRLRQQSGKKTTFYTCCSEPYPNTFTFCEPADAEWLGWYAAKEHLDGYLRWALNSWVLEPLLDSRFYTWAAGDTYLIYPGGRTSVRYERLTAGIQAYEKVRLLREEFKLAGNKESLTRLETALAKFDEFDLPQRPSAEVVTLANKVVNELTIDEEEKEETGISHANHNVAQVTAHNGVLSIYGAPLQAKIRICKVDGSLVKKCTAHTERLQMILPTGLYIVTLEGCSYKVQL